MSNHQHERWQLRPNGKGGVYCAACGDAVDAPLTYGVRDRDTKIVAAHPNRASAEDAASLFEAFELVCTAYPSDPKKVWYAA